MKKAVPGNDFDTILPMLIAIWRKMHKLAGPADQLQTREFRGVVDAVNRLMNGLEPNGSLIGQDYFNQPELLGAYLLYQWVVHYQQGLALLNELPITPRHVLDLCSGPASFAFAALRHGASDVLAVDQNLAALKIGAEICGRYGFPLSIRQWQQGKGGVEEIVAKNKFDLIILGHCLEELFPSTQKGWKEERHVFVGSLLKRLNPKGYLLLVDRSSLDTNKRLLELRDSLVKEGTPIQAPCVWHGNCPVLQTQNSPCYAQREFEKPYLIKEIQRATQIHLSSLKMTYFIFRSPEAAWPTLPDYNLYRVISPPVESFQGKRYYLCGTDGKKLLGSHLSEHPLESRAFEYLKRGELISIEGALEQSHTLDILKETKVSVEAACSKPLRNYESSEQT